MGCCISTQRDPSLSDPQHPTLSPSKPAAINRGPPPSFEEETVKEVLVLSETPIQKPLPKATSIPAITNQECKSLKKNEDEDKTPELSQVSEICSVTESYSTATTTTTATTVTEKREDEAMSKMKRHNNRSPAKVPRKRPYTGGELHGRVRGNTAPKSPARRAGKAPEKRVGGPRPVRGRDLPSKVGNRNQNVGSPLARPDSGETTVRRSRSPATRTGGGVGSGRITRSPSKGVGKVERVAEGVEKEKDDGVGSGSRLRKEETKENDGVLEHPTESLENPLVSLECFIFL